MEHGNDVMDRWMVDDGDDAWTWFEMERREGQEESEEERQAHRFDSLIIDIDGLWLIALEVLLMVLMVAVVVISADDDIIFWYATKSACASATRFCSSDRCADICGDSDDGGTNDAVDDEG